MKKSEKKELKKLERETKQQAIRFTRQFSTIGGITNYENYIKTSWGYMACVTAYAYAKEVDDLWLLKTVQHLQSLSPNITVKFDVVDYPHDLEKVVDTMVDESQDNFDNANKSTVKMNSYSKIQDLLDLYRECKDNGEVLKMTQLRVYVFEKTLKDMELKVSNVQDRLKSKLKILASVSLGNALEDYVSLMNTKVSVPQEMQGRTIARSFPFNSSYFAENGGDYYGRSSTGGTISINLDNKNGERPSNDIVIVGKKGTGKSELLRDIMYKKLLKGGRVILADVEGEHIQFTLDNGGIVISPDDPSFSWNIMQVINIGANFNKTMLFHWTRLKANLKYMVPDINNKQVNMFIKACREVYVEYGFFNTSAIEELPIPKLEVPIQFLKEELEKIRNKKRSFFTKRNEENLEELIEYLEPYIDSTMYGNTFNTNNSIDLSANFITFDLRCINRDEKNIQELQLYNMNILVWNEIVKNKGKSMLSIVFDEDHRFIKPTMPVESLDTRDMIVREARKYEACLILATQSLREYMGTQEGYFADRMKSMLEMMTYRFFYNQDDSAIELIKKIYPRIPRSYLNSLPTASVGELVYDIAGVRSLYGTHVLSSQEIKLFDGVITNAQL